MWPYEPFTLQPVLPHVICLTLDLLTVAQEGNTISSKITLHSVLQETFSKCNLNLLSGVQHSIGLKWLESIRIGTPLSWVWCSISHVKSVWMLNMWGPILWYSFPPTGLESWLGSHSSFHTRVCLQPHTPTHTAAGEELLHQRHVLSVCPVCFCLLRRNPLVSSVLCWAFSG